MEGESVSIANMTIKDATAGPDLVEVIEHQRNRITELEEAQRWRPPNDPPGGCCIIARELRHDGKVSRSTVSGAYLDGSYRLWNGVKAGWELLGTGMSVIDWRPLPPPPEEK
jgi:hypothetical protein